MRRVKSPVDRWRLLVSGLAGRHKRAQPLNNRATLDERLKVLSHRPLPPSRRLMRDLSTNCEKNQKILHPIASNVLCTEGKGGGADVSAVLLSSLLEQFLAKIFHGYPGWSVFVSTTPDLDISIEVEALGNVYRWSFYFFVIARCYARRITQDQWMIFPLLKGTLKFFARPASRIDSVTAYLRSKLSSGCMFSKSWW